VREIYERAIAETPPAEEKRYWRRYIYLWYKYALFEETVAKDLERTQEIFETAIKIVPHKKFSFAKLWTFYAKFLLRKKDVTKMRSVLGYGVGVCPVKDKLYAAYIAIELSMGEIERCRKLYEGLLAYNPTSCKVRFLVLVPVPVLVRLLVLVLVPVPVPVHVLFLSPFFIPHLLSSISSLSLSFFKFLPFPFQGLDLLL
jgi:tetratricopeptide (TPR) repeat protein